MTHLCFDARSMPFCLHSVPQWTAFLGRPGWLCPQLKCTDEEDAFLLAVNVAVQFGTGQNAIAQASVVRDRGCHTSKTFSPKLTVSVTGSLGTLVEGSRVAISVSIDDTPESPNLMVLVELIGVANETPAGGS